MTTTQRPKTAFRPTVVIGLGGTGYGVLLKFKQRLIENYGKVPPVIRLLSIDTTENAQNREDTAQGLAVKLDPSELYQISIANPGAIVKNKNIQEWWPSEVNTLGISRGAGQVRARGRLGLFAKSSDIFSLISQAIAGVRELKNSRQAYQDEFEISNTGGVEVFIVGSIAGGTGSGTFLDVAFMARNGDPSVEITGILALPRIFSNKPITEMVKSNAYGALKEIEHFWQPETSTEIDYGSRQLKVNNSPFDLLFLIDGINESGRIIGDPKDLQDLIADGLYVQVASQIGVDSDNSNDNIKGMFSTRKVCKNKFWVSYCSFGVASLTLPIGDVKKLQLKDSYQLIQDNLLGEASTTIVTEDEVDLLMQRFKLQERTVVDIISEKESGGQLSFPFSLAGFTYNSGADRRIKEKSTQHLSSMETVTANQLKLNYARLLNNTTQSIQEWWEENVNRANGMSYCQQLLDNLAERLEEQQRGFQLKARDYERQQKGIRLDDRETKIKEASSAFLSRQTKVTTACQQYGKIVSQMSLYYLNSKRYDKAVELMGEIARFIRQLLNQQVEIKNSVNQVFQVFQQQINTSSVISDNGNLFVHTIQRFDIESIKPKVTYEDFLVWQKEKNCRVSDWSKMTVAEIKDNITEFIADKYTVLTELSVEDILKQSSLKEAGDDLKQLWDLACPLWRYDEARIPSEDSGTIHEMCLFGTAEEKNSILKNSEIQQSLPSIGREPTIVSTGDRSRITLYRVRLGVPLFALQDIEEMKQDYDDPGKVFKHLHKDWVSLPDLLPTDDNDDVMRYFALGLAFNIIRKKGVTFQVSAQLTGSRIAKEIELGKDRVEAYEKLKQKSQKELLEIVATKVDKMMSGEDLEKVYRHLDKHVHDLSTRLEQSARIKPSLRQQVQAEIDAIDAYIHEHSSSDI